MRFVVGFKFSCWAIDMFSHGYRSPKGENQVLTEGTLTCIQVMSNLKFDIPRYLDALKTA